jgi:hypothetical protein
VLAPAADHDDNSDVEGIVGIVDVGTVVVVVVVPGGTTGCGVLQVDPVSADEATAAWPSVPTPTPTHCAEQARERRLTNPSGADDDCQVFPSSLDEKYGLADVWVGLGPDATH